jgi:hypothetical protein
MTTHRRWLMIPAVVLIMASTTKAQGPTVTPAQAAPFMGTWVFTMTAPPHFKAIVQTVRVWNENGRIAASFQVDKFPALNMTGASRDGDMLVLTLSLDADRPLRENGVPIRTVIMLTPDGGGMRMAQMRDNSQAIERGTGKKQP